MELKTLGEIICETVARYSYGCEGKEYYISFYNDTLEKEERCGCIKQVYGVIENFNPNKQTAIRDTDGDLWLIESKLIAVMRPMTEIELKRYILKSKS